MQKVRGGILAIVAALATAIFYGRAFWFDLQCDDLLMIRPWSRAELAAVWHGTWEPGGAFAIFFRPVATWFYAGTFELFGLNAPAHMLLSLAMLAAVMWLLALFITRESGSLVAGVAAAFLYAIHPNVPWSTGTWVTNDFHKLTAISALCALLLWQRLRHNLSRPSGLSAPSAPEARWLLLVPFVVICFLVKEDGLMLIPVLVSLQWTRAKLVGDVRSPGVSIILGAALLGVALVTWRYLALQELGGFGIPPVSSMFQNLARGPIYAFTLHGSLSVLTVFEKLVAVAVVVVVALGIVLMPREKRFLPIAGLIIMFWYDLPLALISNVMRYYMLTIASVMVVVPAYIAWASQPAYRWVAAVPFALLLLAKGGVGRQERELALFEPCNWAEHNCISWVLDEVKTLPPEARAYVADTATACAVHGAARPHIGHTGTLTWGLGATSIDTTTGEQSNAVVGDIVMLMRRNAETAPLLFRHLLASASQPVRVEVTVNGKRETRELKAPQWLRIDVPVTTGLRSWMRGAHRVDAHFSTPGAEWKRPN